MSKTENITAAKPKVGGAIYSAPLGTALPTDAIAKLDTKFKSLGYISEDGMTNSNSPESDVIKAWGGDTVKTVQTSKEDTFSYKLIEALNVDVLKEVYGSSNVSGTLETGIVVKANSTPQEAHCVIVDMIFAEGILRRIVIPNGKVSEIGEISYVDSDVVGYETTLNALPDEEGNTHYEYTAKGAENVEGKN